MPPTHPPLFGRSRSRHWARSRRARRGPPREKNLPPPGTKVGRLGGRRSQYSSGLGRTKKRPADAPLLSSDFTRRAAHTIITADPLSSSAISSRTHTTPPPPSLSHGEEVTRRRRRRPPIRLGYAMSLLQVAPSSRTHVFRTPWPRRGLSSWSSFVSLRRRDDFFDCHHHHHHHHHDIIIPSRSLL